MKVQCTDGAFLIMGSLFGEELWVDCERLKQCASTALGGIDS